MAFLRHLVQRLPHSAPAFVSTEHDPLQPQNDPLALRGIQRTLSDAVLKLDELQERPEIGAPTSS